MEHPLAAPLHTLACDRHAASAPALTHVRLDGKVEKLRFGEVAVASRALAQKMQEAGVMPGARVVVCLPQGTLAPVAHLAISRAGAVSVPLSPLYGPDALAPRLAAARPALAIVDAQKADAFAEAMPSLTLWRAQGGTLKVTRGPLESAAPPAWSRDAMSLFFTSGTTAAPKGVALPARVVPGRMPGFLRAHAAPGVFWSPADWSWIGGLHDALFAPWLAGVPVFAYERSGPFDPERAGALLREHGVESAFVPPTALKAWRRSGATPPKLRSLHTAGEALPGPVRAWAQDAFGGSAAEVYGLTECAFLTVDGEATPGIRLRQDDEGELLVAEGAPTMMLGYAHGDAIELPLRDGWLATGDVAVQDGERYRVMGRIDDVIKTSGYRVSPGEIEACLLHHPAIAECAVIGEPDEARGQAIVAFVKLAIPVEAADLQAYVRDRLALHLVPRRIVLVDELPTTITGKILRRNLRGRRDDAP